jgi:hypothetical protein
MAYNSRSRRGASFARPAADTTKPASEAQLTFIRGLLADRPEVLAQFGVADVDAAIAGLRANPQFTTFAASGMIDQLKGIAKPVQAEAPRPNRYAGKCRECGVYVAEGAGILVGERGNWGVAHKPGECVTPPAVGLYMHDTGHVSKVYVTQNGNLGVRALVGRTFEYVSGGVARLAKAIAAGEAHLMTQEEAAAWGRKWGFCVNCGRDIIDDRSLAAGFGPVCARRNGWHYPNRTEAANILGRPAGEDAAEADGEADTADDPADHEGDD